MGIRRRVAYVYPGIHKSGVGAIIYDDDRVLKMSVGSIDNYLVAPYLEAFKPEELVLTPGKLHSKDHATVTIPDCVLKVRYTSPSWKNKKVPLVDREHPVKGPYVHNAWKMMFDDAIRRRPVKIKVLAVEELTRQWVLDNGPPRLKHE
jgi:hypothetical protein